MQRIGLFLVALGSAGADFGIAGPLDDRGAGAAPPAIDSDVSEIRPRGDAMPAEICDDPDRLRERMAEALNEARAVERRCGGGDVPAADPVTWDDRLASAAREHSRWMAENDFLGHRDGSGRSGGDRASAAGYRWLRVGENLAAGQSEVAMTMDGWLDSPGHCANIMDRQFTEFGAACATASESSYGTYWTLILARPR